MVQPASTLAVLIVALTGSNAFFAATSPYLSQTRTVVRSTVTVTRMGAVGGENDSLNQIAKREAQQAANDLDRKTNLNKDANTNVQASAKVSTGNLDASKNVEASATTRNAPVVEEHREVIRETPIVKERVFEETIEVDKTREIEERIGTEVQQVIQPIQDVIRKDVDVKKVDQGLEVIERGSAGLDAETEAELKRRKQEVASAAKAEHEHSRKQVSDRPDREVSAQKNVIEQVVPVIEKDIYVPHRVENYKEVKEIIHEKPVVKETIVEPTISRAEFEKKYGTAVNEVPASGPATGKSELREKVSASTEGSRAAVGTGSSSSSSSSSSKMSAGAEGAAKDAKNAVGSATSSSGSGGSGSSSSSDEYNMSSSNMAREAHSGDSSSSSGEGSGIGNVLKKPFQAVSNIVEKLVD